MKKLLVLIALVASVMNGFAEQAAPNDPQLTELLKTNTDQRASIRQLQDENKKLRDLLAAPIYEKFVEIKKREYDFQANMMLVNERIFFHQSIASYVILSLVVLVVGAGVWFAYVQLMAGLRPLENSLARDVQAAAVAAAPIAAATPPAISPPAAAAATPPAISPPAAAAAAATTPAIFQPATSLELSMQKLTVSSSVVGIIVLVISLAFLFIYTREILTLKPVNPYTIKVDAPTDAVRTEPSPVAAPTDAVKKEPSPVPAPQK